MKILITGATGFTGSHTVPLLLEKGFQVRCLVRPTSNSASLPAARVEIVTGDLDDVASLQAAMTGMDGLVNIASLGFGHAPNLITAALNAGLQRTIFVSTTAIFTSLSAGSKSVRVAAEKAIMESGLAYTILRPTMIYGSPRDRNICRLLTYLRRWPLLPVLGNGEFLQQPVHVDDVATAIVQALSSEKAIGQGYNLSGGTAVTYNELVTTAGKLLNRKVWRLHIPVGPCIALMQTLEQVGLRLPISAEQVMRLNEDKAFDHDDAVRDFGYHPRSLATGLASELHSMGIIYEAG